MLVETLASVRTELVAQLGNRDDIGITRYDRWINDAVIAISEEIDMEEFASSRSISTVAGTPNYLLDPDVSIIRSVSLVDDTDEVYGGYPLTQTDLHSYRQGNVIQGMPQEWFQYGNNITFWPIPDAVYSITIDFAIAMSELVNDTDPIPFRPGLSSLVAIRARWIANDALGQFPQAKAAEDQYTRLLQMRLDRKAQQNIGKDRQSSVPRTLRQLRLGARGYYSDIRRPT